MSFIPRVSELTRERISREFDDLGPVSCLAWVRRTLKAENPEVLDMMSKCARDVGNSERIMVGFAMFYRLLVAEALAFDKTLGNLLLPRVSAETRAIIVGEIEEHSADGFTLAACDQLQEDNPELLHMADGFASRYPAYLAIMQGFCLVYRSIALQSTLERRSFH
ncbi:MAG: hypothetical protein JWQ89_4246 [Devosia sp.]|uniref:hypothetical protein n=1 Tax=Devosia sp. TaxID=1871048 RepID=UPI002639CF1D|nr:hypothetical protein [Devosia sp.]MDB5542519.1 hypothetical protein [Devosia sp.]